MGNTKLTSIKKFYFLEYFDILLRSIQFTKDARSSLSYFIHLKDNNKLGESKYKKITPTDEELSNSKILHYKYTYNEVVEEAVILKLIIPHDKRGYALTPLGLRLLSVSFAKGRDAFNFAIFQLMEEKLQGFWKLITSCNKANPTKNGLLVFPIYSPLKLGMTKNEIVHSKDINLYLTKLQKKIEADLHLHLGKKIDLTVANTVLMIRLSNSGLLSNKDGNSIHLNYNKIVKRIRDYWINYILKEIYKLKLSLSYFDLWVYRAKQLGIINTHEFYPGFNGKMVYPISIIIKEKTNTDFKFYYKYSDGTTLYAHAPKWKDNHDDFVDLLFRSYHDIKAKSKSYFINLADLRDMVCFKMKISERTFADFLKRAYLLNLKNNLKIKISLESDKLPEETQAIYLKREPIIIGGKSKNIIAIDLKK